MCYEWRHDQYLRAVITGWAGVYLYEPWLVLLVHHEVVAVQLPRVFPVFNHVLSSN